MDDYEEVAAQLRVRTERIRGRIARLQGRLSEARVREGARELRAFLRRQLADEMHALSLVEQALPRRSMAQKHA